MLNNKAYNNETFKEWTYNSDLHLEWKLTDQKV